MELSGKTVLVTGASSGIGREIATALADQGAKLTLGGRNRAALEETQRLVGEKGSEAMVMAGDVTDSGWRDRAVGETIDHYGQLNGLVNNAGVVAAGRLDERDAVDVEQQILVNLNAAVLMTQSALPALRRSGDGVLVNVSSGFGLVGMPFYATYAATKAGLANFGEAMRRELDGEGVTVLNVYPGATDTPMMDTTGLGPEHGFHYESPEHVAYSLVQALRRDEKELVLGGENMEGMVHTNQQDPGAVDEQLRPMKDKLEQAVASHRRM